MYHINDLPAEIIDDIVSRLDEPSLRNFAATNQNYHHVAIPYIWHTVCVRIPDQDVSQLQIETQQLRDQLSRVGFRHARRLDIIMHYTSTQSRSRYCDAGGSWYTVAELISALPKLEDVFVPYGNRISHDLFSAIEKHGPTLRLHIQNFELNSLDAKTQSRDLAKLRLKIVRSPNLFAIKFNTSWMYKLIEYENDLLDLLGSMNSNLREVSIDTEGESPYGTRKKPSFMYPPTIIQKLSAKERQNGKPAPLTCFELGGHTTSQELGRFAQRCDFTKLRTLQLRHNITPYAVASVMERGIRFPSLESLSLGIPPDTPTVDSQTAAFISSLPPLKSITMSLGVGTPTFNAILDTHGNTVRRLRLGTFHWICERAVIFDAQTIDRLVERCPSVSELSLRTPHSDGDDNELAVYEALSKMKQLQHLSLLLDVKSSSTSISDDNLIRTIFERVDKRQSSAGKRSLRLEELEVRSEDSRFDKGLRRCTRNDSRNLLEPFVPKRREQP